MTLHKPFIPELCACIYFRTLAGSLNGFPCYMCLVLLVGIRYTFAQSMDELLTLLLVLSAVPKMFQRKSLPVPRVQIVQYRLRKRKKKTTTRNIDTDGIRCCNQTTQSKCNYNPFLFSLNSRPIRIYHMPLNPNQIFGTNVQICQNHIPSMMLSV